MTPSSLCWELKNIFDFNDIISDGYQHLTYEEKEAIYDEAMELIKKYTEEIKGGLGAV